MDARWRVDEEDDGDVDPDLSIPVGQGLEEILSEYARARAGESFNKQHQLWSTFEGVRARLASWPDITKHSSLHVTWSAGTGNWAKVPWIAIMDERETTTTQHGVYLVFLFRQDMSGVYLTYNQGVTIPRREHGAKKAREIMRHTAQLRRSAAPNLVEAGFLLDDDIDLRADPGLGSNYEDSTIAYKLYEAGAVPSDETIARDVAALVEAYEHSLGDDRRNPAPIPPSESVRKSPERDLGQIHKDFAEALREARVDFGVMHDDLTRSFLASMATKGFIILTGLSGSGKTQIALRFGDWLGVDRTLVIPVRPDWTGSESLFGYENVLQPAVDGRPAWNVPPALEFMLRAGADPHKPYLLILDEMNLAHVERYFADFLSGMESEAATLPNLRREADGIWRLIPNTDSRIPIPRNMFVIGTVNVDETTYLFSPKVLDRANTFEFRVQTESLSSGSQKPRPARAADDSLVRGLLEAASDSRWQIAHPSPRLPEFESLLKRLHRLLSEAGFEFGHRLFYEATRYCSLLAGFGDDSIDHALDLQVIQKVLPRIHGSRRRLEGTLCALARFCFDLEFVEGSIEANGDRFDPLGPIATPPKLPYSFDKVRRMTRSIRTNQFTSFTE